VPHELLNSPEVNPRHHQTAGESVPEAVPGEVREDRSPYGWIKPATRAHRTEDGLISVADALKSDDPFIRAMAMIDSRVGSGRLQGHKPKSSDHALVRLFYDLRAQSNE
jgi:hypothetical protein